MILLFCFFPLVLYAMKEDSEKVPTLLTDYILKGKHEHSWNTSTEGMLKKKSVFYKVS